MKHILPIILIWGSSFQAIASNQPETSHVSDSITTHSLDSIPFSELKEITVTARRPINIVRADKISYIPSAIIVGSQGNAYDAIQAIPGITIASDGEIKLNGISKLTIYIDGRKTILSGEELIGYLRAMPITDIEKIDLTNSSSAHTDGSDPNTILNLIRSHKKEEGYTVGTNIDNQIGKARHLYGSCFMEYNRNAHNTHINYSTYMAHNPSELLTDRPYMNYDERLIQEYQRLRKDKWHNVSMEYDYQPLEGLKWGSSLHYHHSQRKEAALMTTMIPFILQPTITSNNAFFKTNNQYGEVYLIRNPHTNRNNWTTSFNFFNCKTSEKQLMEDNTGLNIDGDMIGKTFGIVYTFDYNTSLSSHWTLSAGTRFSFVKMNSKGTYTDYYSQQARQSNNMSNNLGSSFGYKENVNAVYVEGKASYHQLNASIGLRGEQSNLYTYFSGNESAENHNLSRHYCRLYPSISLLLSTQTIGSWMLSYTHKTNRPRYSDLDPFIHLFDDITHVGGNINLKESYLHFINLVWTDNSKLRIMLTMEQHVNEIVKYYRELTDKIVYVTPENLPKHLQLILSFSSNNIRICPCWQLSATANVIYSRYYFPKDTGLMPKGLFTPTCDIKNLLTLPFQIYAEFSSSYRAPMIYGQAKLSSLWHTYFGLKKTFGKISVSVYVKDIFNTNHFNSTIYLTGKKAVLYEKEFEDMRKVGISILYHFTIGKSKSVKECHNAWIDELNRVNL